MDRIAKFLILLVAALVLVPGCFAEEMTDIAAEETPVAELVDVVEETGEPVVEEEVELVDVVEETGEPVVEEEAELVDVVEETGEPVVEEEAEEIVPDFTANQTVTLLENVGVNQTVAIALTAEEAEGIWNVTFSEGLEQIGNSTVTEEGAEEFIIKAITAGNQTFSATHEGAETEAGETYTLEIIVA